MRRPIVLLLAAASVTGVLVAAPSAPAAPGAPTAALPPVSHDLVVTGAGVATYPAYDPAVQRYAVTTTAATAGTLTVHASSSDPAAVVRVDGRVAPGGTATVSGLGTGDEVSVFIEDAAGSAVHSLVYLPAGFPALEVPQTSAQVAPGVVGLTLNPIIAPGPRFVTTVDRHGVPTHVLEADDAFDLKDQPDGSITYQAPTTTPGRTGEDVVVLDPSWREVGHRESVGLVNTDLHDSILTADGRTWLMAYELDGAGELDSVFQELDQSGHEVFRWSSDGLQGDSARPDPTDGSVWDYAHMNSMQLLPDGDVVASFRHLSAVLRIATRAHDGYTPGQVVWKLGGRDSDFSFIGDPYGGPCAQHTASVLPNGHVLVFDDGSDPFLAGALCLDQAHPDAAPTTRQQSRVAEYALDPVAGTATLVWSHAPPGWYSWFMGSAARLGNGDTLVGWAADTRALATEVSPAGDVLWQLRLADPKPVPPPISYRASLMAERDAEAPVVSGVSVPEGSTYALGQAVTVDFRCTDRGGSSLRACGGDLRPGGALDTATPGRHSLRLSATDGAGHSTTVTRSYTVTATYQPRWTEERLKTALRGTRVARKVTLVNEGTYADAFVLRGTRGSARLGVRYKLGQRDVTRQVRRGTLRTDALRPGQRLVLRVVVERTARTGAGDRRTFTVEARSVADPARTAAVDVVVRAR